MSRPVAGSRAVAPGLIALGAAGGARFPGESVYLGGLRVWGEGTGPVPRRESAVDRLDATLREVMTAPA